MSLAAVPTLAAAPAIDIDRPAATARRVNTIHLLVRGDGAPMKVVFERDAIVRQVEVINAPRTTHGEVTRVAAADFRVAAPDPLLLRLTVSAARIGRFHLGNIRLRVAAPTGVEVYEDDLHVDLFDDPAYADEELRHAVLADATRIIDGPHNFSGPWTPRDHADCSSVVSGSGPLPWWFSIQATTASAIGGHTAPWARMRLTSMIAWPRAFAPS